MHKNAGHLTGLLLKLAYRSPPAFVSNRPSHRPDRQQRADHRFQIGGLDVTFGEQRRARDGQDLADQGDDAGFSMVFSCSDFIGGDEEFAWLHGRQSL